MINSFSGVHRFLSNFYYVNILYYDRVYPSVEHFYQAMKSLSDVDRVNILNAPSAAAAKKMGAGLTLRPDWDLVKIPIMDLGLRKKFSNADLAQKLIETYPNALVEGNYWNDKFWGFCLKTGIGENHLGELLDRVRLDLLCDVPLLAGPDPVF